MRNTGRATRVAVAVVFDDVILLQRAVDPAVDGIVGTAVVSGVRAGEAYVASKKQKSTRNVRGKPDRTHRAAPVPHPRPTTKSVSPFQLHEYSPVLRSYW